MKKQTDTLVNVKKKTKKSLKEGTKKAAKKPTKKTKLKSLSSYKKDLWDVFTYYIKLKYTVDGKLNCYTCGVPIQINTVNCQGGHYHPKKGYPALYFNENNVRPQCFRCNHWLEGNTIEFGKRLLKEIGQEEFDKMDQLKREQVKITRSEYKIKIEYYKNEIKKLTD